MDTIICAQDKGRLAAIALLALGLVMFTLTPPLAQPAGYHAFADARTLLGVPNFWNVASNLPFLVAGVLGLRALARDPRGVLPMLRPAYRAFFAGAIFVGLGSAAYHVDPTDASLAIDRLPMAIAFMALVAIVVGEHVDERLGARVLAPLVALGVSSVLYWHVTGDLRPYVLVQFAPLVAIPIVLWRRASRLDSVAPLWGLLAAYAAAKALELADAGLFAAIHVTGGHALKHVVAACGIALMADAARNRRPRASPGGAPPRDGLTASFTSVI